MARGEGKEMTIPEFAKLADRTPQAIYARLKQEKISVSELQEDDKKTLSQDGLSILSSLFHVSAKEIKLEERNIQTSEEFEQNKIFQDKETAQLKRKLEQLSQENEQLKIENAELKATAAGKDQLIAALTARAEFAEKISLQRLPGETAPRRTLWERITGRKPEGKQDK